MERFTNYIMQQATGEKMFSQNWYAWWIILRAMDANTGSDEAGLKW
jgi:hypothetical protein